MVPISYRKKQAQQTKALIFNTALALFQDKGFENVSVEDIVRSAQVSRGSFYTYYRNKEDLLGDYVHRNDEIYLAFYQDVLCSAAFEHVDAMSKIEQLLWYTVENLSAAGANLLHLYNIYLIKTPDIYAKRDRYFFSILNTLFHDAVRDHSIRKDLSYDCFQEIALWITRGITIDWAGSGGSYPFESRRKIISEFVRYVRACPENSQTPPITFGDQQGDALP